MVQQLQNRLLFAAEKASSDCWLEYNGVDVVRTRAGRGPGIYHSSPKHVCPVVMFKSGFSSIRPRENRGIEEVSEGCERKDMWE